MSIALMHMEEMYESIIPLILINFVFQALHYAKNSNIAEIILEKCNRENMDNIDKVAKWTPLYYAICNGNDDLVQVFLFFLFFLSLSILVNFFLAVVSFLGGESIYTRRIFLPLSLSSILTINFDNEVS